MPHQPPDAQNGSESKMLARAIVDALDMWSNSRYARFLGKNAQRELDSEWFKWFIGAWTVARTIKRSSQKLVCSYVASDFKKALENSTNEARAAAVDAAALHIQSKGWSKGGCLPRSLVAKMGFFFCPNELVPYDQFAHAGLNELDGHALNFPTYQEFLRAFNGRFSLEQDRIRRAVSEAWVKALADKYRCPPTALSSQAMQRKIFDNFLLELGREKSDRKKRRA